MICNKAQRARTTPNVKFIASASLETLSKSGTSIPSFHVARQRLLHHLWGSFSLSWRCVCFFFSSFFMLCREKTTPQHLHNRPSPLAVTNAAQIFGMSSDLFGSFMSSSSSSSSSSASRASPLFLPPPNATSSISQQRQQPASGSTMASFSSSSGPHPPPPSLRPASATSSSSHILTTHGATRPYFKFRDEEVLFIHSGDADAARYATTTS